MRALVVSLLLIFIFTVETLITGNIEFFGIAPTISFVVVVSYSLLRGNKEGMVVGGIVGLLHDIYFGNAFGVFLVMYIIVGFLAGTFNKNFYRESYTFTALVAMYTIFVNIVYYFVHYIHDKNISILAYVYKYTFIEMVYNVLISLLIFPMLYYINEMLENKEARRI